MEKRADLKEAKNELPIRSEKNVFDHFMVKRLESVLKLFLRRKFVFEKKIS